ncbi:Protein SPIRAL1-like 1 [Dionaea muscipula]
MGRGVSSGGGQSSLGYLFGSGEAPKPASNDLPLASNEGQAVKEVPSVKPSINPQLIDVSKQILAGIHSSQNSGNFITDRPTTKVHAAPGGGSSLGYLFGSGGSGS